MSERGVTILDEFCLRAAGAQDLDGISEVEQASFSHPWPRTVFERELINDWSVVEVLVAPDDRLMGHLVYWVVEDELHLLNIAIRPEVRRRGLARALMHHLEDVCRQRELIYLTLEVRVSNSAAVALYRSEGYKIIHRRKNYYVEDREDALVMAKVLEPVNRA